MKRNIHLIRHGAVESRYFNRYVGSKDLPLSEEGREQARLLAGQLSGRNDFSCLCSPMKRTRETAGIALKGMENKIRIEEDLREIDFGRWEGMSFSEIQATDPGHVDQWSKYEKDFRFPDGESIENFSRRLGKVREKIIGHASGDLFIVTHGGVIRALLCSLLGLPARHHVAFQVNYSSVTRIKLVDGFGVLAGLNDLSHLKK